MRDYAELLLLIKKELSEVADCQGCCAQYEVYEPNGKCLLMHSADAIGELLAAVPSVVKCKECRWCHSGYCEKYDDLIPFGCANKPWEDWFCAEGKRPEPPKEVE